MLDLTEYRQAPTQAPGNPSQCKGYATAYADLERQLLREFEGRAEGADRYRKFGDLLARDIAKNKGAYPDKLEEVLSHPVILGDREVSWLKGLSRANLDNYENNAWKREVYNSNYKTRGNNYVELADISERYHLENETVIAFDQRTKEEITDKFLGKGRIDWQVKDLNCLDLANYDDIDNVPKRGIVALKSAPGTGKTKGWILNHIKRTKPPRVLYVSMRRSIIDSFCVTAEAQGIHFTNYQSIESGYGEHDYLAICIDSLRKLFEDGYFKHYPLIIFDECESMFNENLLKDPKIGSNIERLVKASESAHFLDADFTDMVSGMALYNLAQSSHIDSIYYQNHADYMKGMEVYTLPSPEQAFQKVQESLEEGKLVYLHYDQANKRKKLKAVKEYFQEQFPNITVEAYCADENDDDLKLLKTDANKFLEPRILREDKPLRLLIVTGWAERGWDVTNPKFKFDLTVGIYEGNYKSGEDIAQALRRPRFTDEHWVYIKRQYEYTRTRAVKDAQEVAIAGYSKIEKHFSEDVYDRAKERALIIKANMAYHFQIICEERGAIYEEVTIDIGNKIRKLISELALTEEENEIVDRYKDDYKRAIFLERYCENLDLFNDTSEPLSEKIIKNMEFEEFKELFIRDIDIREDEIQEILYLWSLDQERRRIHNLKDNWVAVLKGLLCDEIDKLIRTSGITPAQSLISFHQDRDVSEIELILDKDTIEPIRHYLQAIMETETNSYFFLKKHKTQPYVWLEHFFQRLDFDAQLIQNKAKLQVKKEIISYYKEKGLLKGISKVGAQTVFIDGRIAEKISDRQKLLDIELDWLRADKKSLVIKKKRYQHSATFHKFSKFSRASKPRLEFFKENASD
jgi:hypothetical protein